eukprot:31251-Pelagococcus_subviridis.AAC.6
MMLQPELADGVVHVLDVDDHLQPRVLALRLPRLPHPLRRRERDVLHDLLEHRVQPPRADVVHGAVHLRADVRDVRDRGVRERQVHALGLEQRLLLLDHVRLRLGEDAEEVLFREALEFHLDRQAALELREHVRGLALMKRAARDE